MVTLEEEFLGARSWFIGLSDFGHEGRDSSSINIMMIMVMIMLKILMILTMIMMMMTMLELTPTGVTESSPTRTTSDGT